MMGIGALLFVLFGGGDMLLPNRTANEDFFLSVILPIHATNLSTAGAGEGCGRNHCSSRFGYHIQHLIDFLEGIRARIRCWPRTWKGSLLNRVHTGVISPLQAEPKYAAQETFRVFQ